jgi:hypothetical protein
MGNIFSIIIASAIVISSFFMGLKYQPATQKLGGAMPSIQALFETSLQSSITSNATTATLVSGTDFAGNNLSGYYCFTIDAGTVQNEFVCGNASGTSLTNLVRGINPALGISSNTALEFPHRRGADVKMTDAPYISLYSNIFNGTQSIPSTISYDPALVTTSTIGSNSNNLASVGYVNSVAIAGAPNGSPTTKGIYQEATTSTIALGTIVGSTGADLVLTQRTASTTASPYSVVERDASGTINVGGINSASTTLNGTTTINGNAIISATTTFSNAPTINNAGTNPSSVVTYGQITPQKLFKTTFATSSATFNWTVPAGVNNVVVTMVGGGGGGGGGNNYYHNGGGGGGSGGVCEQYPIATTPGSVISIVVGGGGVGGSDGNPASAGNNGGSSSFGSLTAGGGGGGGAGGGSSSANGAAGSTGASCGAVPLTVAAGGETGGGNIFANTSSGAGNYYGGGGGAGYSTVNGDYPSGSGAPGFVFIQW